MVMPVLQIELVTGYNFMRKRITIHHYLLDDADNDYCRVVLFAFMEETSLGIVTLL